MSVLPIEAPLEILEHEAIVRQMYLDSVGVPTWSVGMTDATGHRVKRYKDNPAPMRRCLEVFVWALENYSNRVFAAFDGVPLAAHELSGAISFHWNTGSITTASWVDAFKAGDMADAERRFLLWDSPPEIKKRRKKEADLIFRGQFSHTGKVTEYTRVTSRYTPDWGSAIRVDVRDELEMIMWGQDVIPAPEDPELSKLQDEIRVYKEKLQRIEGIIKE